LEFPQGDGVMSFIETYMEYTWETEPPRIFHRWAAISCIAAALGRNFYIQHGHFRVFPNLYTMLIGDAGTRKSTAVKLARKTLSAAGYDDFAADKTTKEKFLLDLEGAPEDDTENGTSTKETYDKVLSQNIWGENDHSASGPRECFIAADEWNEFAGAGNLEFYTTLGNLWDWDDDSRPFTQRLKNSKSVAIYQPTINILGGNTPENFAKAFPPEIIGQGFLSRMILIHGERSNRKYTFPPVPPEEATRKLRDELSLIRASHLGCATLSEEALKILDAIYHGWVEIDDVRFKSYSNRRFTQLLKLVLIVAASAGSKQIDDWTVLYANSMLAAAEHHMPRALGEFGKGKNSDVTNKIMDVLKAAHAPVSVKDIWQHVHNDLEKMGQLSDMLQGLQVAEKIQFVSGRGYLPKRTPGKTIDFVDFSILTAEEQEGL